MSKRHRAATKGGLNLLLSTALLCGCGRHSAKGEPAELVASGWNYFRQGDFLAANGSFSDALALVERNSSSATSASLRLKALYGMAQTWDLGLRDADHGKAASVYHQIVQLAPASDEAAWSMLALARMKHVVPVGQQPKLPAVRRAYQEVIDHFPGHPAAQEAFVYQQSTLVASLNGDDARSALALLSSFVRDHPDSKFVSPAWGLMAVCHATLGNPAASLAANIKSLQTREVDPSHLLLDSAGSYWQLATQAEFAVGDFATAREYYQKLIVEDPTDQRIFPARQELARMDAVEKSIETRLKQNRAAAGTQTSTQLKLGLKLATTGSGHAF